jgi:SPP1 gp7 family putative phage head morphogenesis protein
MAGLDEAADRHRRELLAGERAAAGRMVEAYGAAWRRIKASLDDLTAEIAAAGDEASPAWLYRQARYRALLAQTEAELRRFAIVAEAEIVAGQREAVQAAQAHAAEQVAAALGEPPAGVIVAFDRLPAGATEELVGALADGSPLRDLLDELGPSASAAVREALVAGVATGQGPREIARRIRAALGGDLARALTIARTETLRAYREASRRAYLANGDVVRGWTWHAARSPRTCAMCWAMHGTVHRLDERMATHVNCRCAMVPLTRTWAELGFPGAADARPAVERGEVRFRRLSEADQLAVLGPGKFAAWTAGEIELADLVIETRSARWGAGRREASLAEALGGRSGSAAADD